MANWGQSIVNALEGAVNLILTFIPRLLGFIIIIAVGWVIAYLVSKGVTLLLRKVGFDRLAARIGLNRFEQNTGVRMDAAGILGAIVFWFLLLIFLVPAADALGLPAVSNVLNALVDYIPNVFVAILVLFLGALAGTFVADIIRGAVASTRVGHANLFAGIARWSIIGFAALIALEQLQIAPALLNILFTGIVFALALAFALAFGLGGQDAARRWLARGETTVTSVASGINEQYRQNEQRRAQQIQAEQARAQQMQAEQLRAQQIQAQQFQANQARANQMQAEQARSEQMGSYQQQFNDTPNVQQNPQPNAPNAPTVQNFQQNPNAPQPPYGDTPTETYNRPPQN